MKQILLPLLLVLLLLGCGTEERTPETTLPPPISTEAPTEALPPETTAPVQISVTFEHFYDMDEYGILTATDGAGNVLWVYETEHYAAQLDLVVDVGQWEDRYYLIDGGNLVALCLSDGTLLWRNTDFSGSPAGEDAMLIDTDGTVYLCGYFGPDFAAVSSQGVTLHLTDTLNSNYFWAYRLEKDGNTVTIYFSGGLKGDIGDLGYPMTIDLS